MARLPTSLSIALWVVGSSWLLAALALYFDVSGEIVAAGVLFGVVTGALEWIERRHNNH